MGLTTRERGHPRNLAVCCQRLYGSNKYWKKRYGYNKRSLSETATYRVNPLLGGRLILRNDYVQVDETYAMIKALNKKHIKQGCSIPKFNYARFMTYLHCSNLTQVNNLQC